MPYQHADSDLKFILNYVLFTLLLALLSCCTIRSGTETLELKIFMFSLSTPLDTLQRTSLLVFAERKSLKRQESTKNVI